MGMCWTRTIGGHGALPGKLEERLFRGCLSLSDDVAAAALWPLIAVVLIGGGHYDSRSDEVVLVGDGLVGGPPASGRGRTSFSLMLAFFVHQGVLVGVFVVDASGPPEV